MYGHCVPSNWKGFNQEFNPGLLLLNSQSSCSPNEKSSPAAGSQTCSAFSTGEDYPIYSNRDSNGFNSVPSGSCQIQKVVRREEKSSQERAGLEGAQQTNCIARALQRGKLIKQHIKSFFCHGTDKCFPT